MFLGGFESRISYNPSHPFTSFKAILASQMFDLKCNGKNLEEIKQKKKIKRKIEIGLNSTYYFYLLFQIYFTYVNLFIQILNNLEICKFVSNFIYIYFLFVKKIIRQSNIKIIIF